MKQLRGGTTASHRVRAVRAAGAAWFLLFAAQMNGASAASAESGRKFAEENCAACHAIGRVDESPLEGAPPLRTLHENYPVEHLFEAFAEGIVTGHPDMPDFILEPEEIEDLIAYLKTLED